MREARGTCEKRTRQKFATSGVRRIGKDDTGKGNGANDVRRSVHESRRVHVDSEIGKTLEDAASVRLASFAPHGLPVCLPLLETAEPFPSSFICL